jgi:CHASE1-domain containing sensor protein/two-component sensor histidine kinase
MSTPRSLAVRRNLPATPLIVLAVGLIATAVVTALVWRITKAKDEERFEYAVSQAQDNIKGRLDTYVAMLRAGAGFVTVQRGAITRVQFQDFVEQLQIGTQYPGVQGIGFSARLPGRKADVPRDALMPFGTPELKVYPPGVRNEIHAIVHLEPMDRRNLAALGYDMFSEPVRRAAMEVARDTGLPAASGRVQLVQEIDEQVQAGFLIYVPVYRHGAAPPTLPERRAQLLGFVYSPFRADDLMRGIFGSSLRPRVNVEIFDREPLAGNLLHRSFTEPTRARYSTVRSLDVAGRPWAIRYSTRPEFEFSSTHLFTPFVFIGGLVATLVMTALAWSQTRARQRADAAVVGMQISTHKLGVLHATAARLAAELDLNRLVQSVVDAGRELSEAEIGAFFYNAEEGENRIRLFALSGAPREAFATFGMPRNTELFAPTFRGEYVIRSADIRTDPRYGKNSPHVGVPPGHWPVRSYLAVPVISRSGEVLGGLLFGHSQVGVFTPQAEQSIVALAGHAAVAIDNARLFKASQDEIAARKKVEAHQKLLLDELNHRVKNTLATVQSIAVQTLRSTSDAASFKTAFEARLIALSEAHNLLSRAEWRGVSLRDLVERELTPFQTTDRTRITVDGPEVRLPPALGLAMGLAIHELATNAVRHGSLQSLAGKVTVSWQLQPVDGRDQLELTWQESGGPPVVPPTRRGFGSRLIERGLKQDLQGEARMYFEREGLRCVIRALVPTEREDT